MKKKANTSWKRNIALIGAGAVIVMVLIVQFDRPAPVTIPETVLIKPIATPEPSVQVPFEMAADEIIPEEITTNDRKTPVPSFAEAFAEARETLGPGQVFYWNGQAYTTNRADEVQVPDLALDSVGFQPASVNGPPTTAAVTIP